MRVTFVLFLFIVFILMSCATTRAYENVLGEWRGHTKEELVSKWGNPSRVEILNDNGKNYVYEKENSKTKFIRDPSSKQTVPFFDCVTSFLIDRDGLVAGWKYDGPNCRK